MNVELQSKDSKARAIIDLQVADNQLHLIREQSTAKEDRGKHYINITRKLPCQVR